MRDTIFAAAASLVMSGVFATAQMMASVDITQVLGFDAGPDNFYNAPNPPWVAGSSPGWYYGPSPQNHPDLWCLHDVSNRNVKVLFRSVLKLKFFC